MRPISALLTTARARGRLHPDRGGTAGRGPCRREQRPPGLLRLRAGAAQARGDDVAEGRQRPLRPEPRSLPAADSSIISGTLTGDGTARFSCVAAGRGPASLTRWDNGRTSAGTFSFGTSGPHILGTGTITQGEFAGDRFGISGDSIPPHRGLRLRRCEGGHLLRGRSGSARADHPQAVAQPRRAASRRPAPAITSTAAGPRAGRRRSSAARPVRRPTCAPRTGGTGPRPRAPGAPPPPASRRSGRHPERLVLVVVLEEPELEVQALARGRPGAERGRPGDDVGAADGVEQLVTAERLVERPVRQEHLLRRAYARLEDVDLEVPLVCANARR